MVALKLHDAPTDEELMRLAADNPGYRFERGADGRLLVSPTGGESGTRNSRLCFALELWNRALAEPGVCFDSSTGFALPDRSVIVPDGAWVAAWRWEALTQKEREGFVPLVPDVVVEIVSKTDTPAMTRAKLERCRALGAPYVLLLDPYSGITWSEGDAPHGLQLTLDTLK
jgi:Uma2 family endonuclease